MPRPFSNDNLRFYVEDAVEYNLWELADKIEKVDQELADDLFAAVYFIGKFCDKLEKKKEIQFNRSVEIWYECKIEWDQAAMNYIEENDKNTLE